MYESIKNFPKQFSYEPKIIYAEYPDKKSEFVIVGMGGSAHTAKLLRTARPDIDITIHQDYGLPDISDEKLRNKLIILSSYSGGTEEVIDAFKKAMDKKLSVAVVAVGGELLRLAKENKIPYIQLPDAGVQPRMALGLSLKAILKLIGDKSELEKLAELESSLVPDEYEDKARQLGKLLKGHIPVVYASGRNLALANIWKIKLNETGKIPAFYNVFPELNHNEMTGYDVQASTKDLSSKLYFIVLTDADDDKRITKRMEVLEKLFTDRGLHIITLELAGANIWQKIFASLLLADFTAYHLAKAYEVEPEQVPMVEEFKKLILE